MTEQPPVTVRNRIEVLDYLRLISALMVVAYHYIYIGPSRNLLPIDVPAGAEVVKYGYLGVNLFFIISGFVIMQSARGKTARQFSVGRMRRLYPSFWVAVPLATLAIAIGGETIGRSVSLGQFLANLTMFHWLVGVDPVDGVYWTLTYELIFYLGVFFLLAVRRGDLLPRIFPWAAYVLLALVIAPLPPLPLTPGFLCYFVAGALIAEARRSGFRPHLVVAIAASAAGCVLAAREYAATSIASFSPDVASIVVILMLICMLLLCVKRFSNMKLPGSRTVGALTYPLYLLHQVIGYVILGLFITEDNKWLAIAGVTALMVGISFVINRAVEERTFWWPFFDRVTTPSLWFRPLWSQRITTKH